MDTNKMEANKQEYDKYARAKKRVEDIKGFYSNLISYIVIIPFLVFINLRFSPGHHWFIYPMIFWGLGIIIHGFGVFGKSRFFGRDWEERKIREIMKSYDDEL